MFAYGLQNFSKNTKGSTDLMIINDLLNSFSLLPKDLTCGVGAGCYLS